MAIRPFIPQPAGAGTGDALVANPLSQFASTSSTQLRSVINNETGTDKLVFSDSPVLVTPDLDTPTVTNPNATLPTYADEAAAVTGGLTTGDVYMTAAGALRIKL